MVSIYRVSFRSSTVMQTKISTFLLVLLRLLHLLQRLVFLGARPLAVCRVTEV